MRYLSRSKCVCLPFCVRDFLLKIKKNLTWLSSAPFLLRFFLLCSTSSSNSTRTQQFRYVEQQQMVLDTQETLFLLKFPLQSVRFDFFYYDDDAVDLDTKITRRKLKRVSSSNFCALLFFFCFKFQLNDPPSDEEKFEFKLFVSRFNNFFSN